MLGRQLQDQAAAIAQGEQVRQEQEHPQIRALAVHVGGHPGQGVGQLVPAQSRQHPRVGAQGIAVEARGAGRFQPLEVAGLGLLDAAGEVHRTAAGAVGELQQGPAVVDQLETVPQAREGGVFQPGGLVKQAGLAGWRGGGTTRGRCPAAADGGHWLLAALSPLPGASMGHWPIHARSALFWSGLKGKQVEQAAGAWVLMWVRRRTERDQLPV